MNHMALLGHFDDIMVLIYLTSGPTRLLGIHRSFMLDNSHPPPSWDVMLYGSVIVIRKS